MARHDTASAVPTEEVSGRLLDVLSRVTLFMGMSVDELRRVVGKTRIEFLKHAPGEVIVRQGDKCGRLLVLIKGVVWCHTATDDRRYAVTETVSAPAAMQTAAIFGLFQQFTHTLTAQTAVSLVALDKKEVLKLLASSMIFRLNLVNSLSTTLQKRQYDLWHAEPHDIGGRLVNFMRRRCITPSGPKTFHVRMQVLADEVNCSRLDVSHALHAMQERGLVELHRGRIEVPAMQTLISGA